MSPHDPYREPPAAAAATAASSQMQDLRHKGYTKHQMLHAHNVTPVTELGPEPSGRASFRRSRTITRMEDVGCHDLGRSEDFLGAGAKASLLTREHRGTLSDRYQPTAVFLKERAKLQGTANEYSSYQQECLERQRNSMLAERAQKHKDMEMLRNYDPWSKGPPTPKRLVAVETTYRRDVEHMPKGYVDEVMGKMGNGAPVRTGSGTLRAERAVDAEMQLNNVYKSNTGPDAVVKYGEKSDRPTYRMALGQQVQEKQRELEFTRTQDLIATLQEQVPFTHGDEGPKPTGKIRKHFGVPSRERNSEHQASYREELGRQMAEQSTLRQWQRANSHRDDSAGYSPWNKDQVSRDADGRVVKPARHKSAQPVPGASLSNDLGRPGGGAPQRDEHGTLITKTAAVERAVTRLPISQEEPWGKSGGGAPIMTESGEVFTKTPGVAVHDVTGVTEYRKTNRVHERKVQLRQAEEEFVRERRDYREREQALVQQSPGDADIEYFKWGQGTANPKRDAKGIIIPQRRYATDVVLHKQERGGGVGRRQKSELSAGMYTALEQLAAERRQREMQSKVMDRQLDRQHTDHADFHGRGCGNPRKDEVTGELHGRFGLDHTEVHHVEVLDRPKAKPKEERQRYGQELQRVHREHTRLLMRETEQALRRANGYSNEEFHKGFNRPGAGAPLQDPKGQKETKPCKLVPRNEREYKLEKSTRRI